MTAPTVVCTAHHWRIESPQGPTSLGVCIKCKAKRSFPNFMDESSWMVWRDGGMTPENTAGRWNRGIA